METYVLTLAFASLAKKPAAVIKQQVSFSRFLFIIKSFH